MTVNQILILDKPTNEAKDLIDSNKQRFAAYYKNHDYKLWDDEEIQSFLNEKFGKSILKAYLQLKPYCYKSDLARFAAFDVSFSTIRSLTKASLRKRSAIDLSHDLENNKAIFSAR